MIRRLAAIVAAVVVFSLSATAGEVTIELPARSATSAAVFDAAGNLVRTLWRGRPHAGGPLRVEWDGRDDDGQTVAPGGSYSARVLGHDVRYVWEGVIGNTSIEQTGASVHRGMNPIADVAIDGAGNAFYVVGYNEQQNAIHQFRVADPQVRIPLARDDYRRVFRYAATDGTLAYFANIGLLGAKGAFNREPQTFVIALNAADGKEHVFADGRAAFDREPWRNRWESVVDFDNDDEDDGRAFRSAPGGLAVQRSGNVLFVAHPLRGEVRLFDKRAGTALGRIEIPGAADLDVAPDDSLWVLRRAAGVPAVVRYLAAGGDWARAAELTADLVDPVAIGVSPQDGTLVVADAGTEQLVAFDAAGNRSWTLGRPGGYRSGGPEVAADRFWFSAGPTYVAFQADGSFWVGDPGNFRNLHFDRERRYLEQILYTPSSYTAAVDSAHPERVFDRYLEFRVDYSKPPRDGWTLVRNWAAGLPARYFGFADGIRVVATLANGRTYAMVPRFDPETKELVELADGGLRPTGITLSPGVRLYADGSQRTHSIHAGMLTISERRLTGFNGGGDPQWDGWRSIARARAMDDVDPFYHQVPTVLAANEATYAETANGVIVSFSPGTSRGFHLGGIGRGAERWRWRASPVGTWQLDGQGMIVAADGSYELRAGVHYPASIATAAGADIVYGYHGEGWNQGQANQWIHYQDDGLFVGQFGTPTYVANNRVEARAGSAGNAFAPTLVKVGDELYLWHNDESVHAGVHRWRIAGLNTMVRNSASIAP